MLPCKAVAKGAGCQGQVLCQLPSLVGHRARRSTLQRCVGANGAPKHGTQHTVLYNQQWHSASGLKCFGIAPHLTFVGEGPPSRAALFEEDLFSVFAVRLDSEHWPALGAQLKRLESTRSNRRIAKGTLPVDFLWYSKRTMTKK